MESSSKTVVASAVFITCLIFYMLLFSGHHYSLDGMVMFQYAKSLYFDHSFKMNPPVKWAIFEFTVPPWAVGLSLAYIPLLAVLSKTIFAGDGSIRTIPFPAVPNYEYYLMYNRVYEYCAVLNPLITALTAAILYLVCVELGWSKKRAGAAALTFGLVSPAAVYSKLDFAQPLASLFLLSAFFLLLKARKKERKKERKNLLSTWVLPVSVLAWQF